MNEPDRRNLWLNDFMLRYCGPIIQPPRLIHVEAVGGERPLVYCPCPGCEQPNFAEADDCAFCGRPLRQTPPLGIKP